MQTVARVFVNVGFVDQQAAGNGLPGLPVAQ